MNTIIIVNKIADGRKARGLSQSKFAEILNITPQAVGKWERGESLPDILMLIKIAETIGADLNYFSDAERLNSESPKDSIFGCKGNAENAEDLSNFKNSKNKAWNMSFRQWKNADFSGLRNPSGKMGGSNIECKFIGADLAESLSWQTRFQKIILLLQN